MKLSIVIPMYNVELYIEKCLLSCLKQDIPSNDYEIIVVNDGSPDNSLTIVQHIAEKEDNIRIVSQPNGGLSAARNKGLSLAKGEYVWFIDSDDWIEENCLEYLLSLCYGVDVVAISHSIIDNNIKTPCYVKTAETGIELLSNAFFQPAQFYIYRKSFLENYNLYFMQGIFHEDMEFTPRMLYYAQSLITTDCCIYNYLHRPASIMSTINPKRAFDLIKVINSLFEFKKVVVDRSYWFIYDNLIALGLNNALFIISQSVKEKQEQWLSELKMNQHLLETLPKSTKLRYKLQGYLFRMIPLALIIKAYNLMQLLNRKLM